MHENVQVKNEYGKIVDITREDLIQNLTDIHRSLAHRLTIVKQILPKNNMWFLINALGGPGKVAELSGREYRHEKLTDNKFRIKYFHGDVIHKLFQEDKDNFLEGPKTSIDEFI